MDPHKTVARLCALSFSLLLSACTVTTERALTETEPEPKEQASRPALDEKTPSEFCEEEPVANTIRIAAVGDIMLGTDFPDNRLAPDDGAGLLMDVTPVLATADLTFGNLEGVLLTGGEAAKKCKNNNSCYVFRSPPHYAQYFKDAGFDVLSVANNHARDFGEEGRAATIATLTAHGIAQSGRRGEFASHNYKGLTVGVVAYAPYYGSNPMLEPQHLQEMVARLKRLHDVVLVSFHGGKEGREALRIPFTEEYYYGERRGDVVQFAHIAIDAGADLVIGHGPHVPRALELYKGRLIAYSLGNFATYQGVNIRKENGLAPILMVELDDEGRFINGRVVSAYQQRPQGTLLDVEHKAARLIGRLTEQDFPQGRLELDLDGNIIHKQPSTPSDW